MPKVKKPKNKAIFKPYESGTVFTSENVEVAGSEFAKNNARETVLYNDPNDELKNRLISLILEQNPGMTIGSIDKNKTIKRGTLSFVFYEQPTIEPNTPGYKPTLSGEPDESIPNFYRVFYFTPTKVFNDGLRHQCLGILYGGKRLKIKYSGTNEETGLPFFYVEDPVFEKKDTSTGKWLGEQTKWYGTFVNIPVPSGNPSFGKNKKNKKNKKNINVLKSLNNLKCLNSDINYLKKLKR